jgi:DNA-nicking Smr family endonuclease
MAGKRSLSHEEQSLWHKAMGDVARRQPEAPPLEPDRPKAKSAAKKPARQNKAAPPPAPPPIAPPAERHHELAPGRAAGLDKRNAQRLRRGQLRPEARIDLHGMTQAEAHGELNGFVAESQMAGRRKVLVITGKGSVKDGGVLRRMVPRWLNQPPLRAMVVAIEQAAPRDGGLGAYYLLLRRRR